MVTKTLLVLLAFAAAAGKIPALPARHGMVLTSRDFENGGRLPLAQVNSRCGGEDRSPQLSWTGAPPDTKSFALTAFDPDANDGHGFWHWVVFNIPPSLQSVAEGAAMPQFVQTQNDFGTRGYGGACPPPGPLHHYRFELYALDAAKAPFGADAKPADAVAWFRAHGLATGRTLAIYQK